MADVKFATLGELNNVKFGGLELTGELTDVKLITLGELTEVKETHEEVTNEESFRELTGVVVETFEELVDIKVVTLGKLTDVKETLGELTVTHGELTDDIKVVTVVTVGELTEVKETPKELVDVKSVTLGELTETLEELPVKLVTLDKLVDAISEEITGCVWFELLTVVTVTVSMADITGEGSTEGSTVMSGDLTFCMDLNLEQTLVGEVTTFEGTTVVKGYS